MPSTSDSHPNGPQALKMANLPRQLLALVPGISLGMFLNHK